MTRYDDKNGVRIEPGDVLKLFHFTDRKRKRHYMYKRAILRDGELYIEHLSSEGGFHPICLIARDTEIVQSKNWNKL